MKGLMACSIVLQIARSGAYSISKSSLSLLLRLCRATALSAALRLDINDLEVELRAYVLAFFFMSLFARRLLIYFLFH